MEQLLNADGTPSFTNISNLRTNFEERFARKQLGATMKSIVIKCINHIENNKVFKIIIVRFFFFSCTFIITRWSTKSHYDYCKNNYTDK